MTFTDDVHAIYGRHPNHIHPYIGSAFTRPGDTVLRVMAIGINAYVSAKDWDRTKPEWFAGWIQNQTYRFGKTIRKAAATLGRAVIGPESLFAGRAFHDIDSLYVTNAVKAYVPESAGKRAEQITDAHYDRHADQWHDELRAMGDHDVLPHVVIVFGEPFWDRAWRTFDPKESKQVLDVRRYSPAEGEALHHANRIGVHANGREHDLLLVRLRHPAARTKKGSAAWLLEQPGYVALARSTGDAGRER